MRSGELYDFKDAEIQASFEHAKRLCCRLQTLSMYDEAYRSVITDLVPGLPSDSTISPPFHCDHGDGIEVGHHVFINYSCVFLDGGLIRIGDHTLIGPACQLYTAHHPLDFARRREGDEYDRPITIGQDCWLGGGVIVCPGVTIGDRCVIGAGSVVVSDIPADSLAAGNPAVVKRRLDGKNSTETQTDQIPG